MVSCMSNLFWVSHLLVELVEGLESQLMKCIRMLELVVVLAL